MNTQALLNETALSTPALLPQQIFFPVKEFVTLPEFAFLTESSIRHLLFNSRTRYSTSGETVLGNGLAESGAIIRVGRRILIDVHKFREWLISQREIVVPA